MSRMIWWLPATAVVAVIAAAALWSRSTPPSAIRGGQLARDLGCFACHGPGGQGGVADPAAPGGEIPDWRYETIKLFASSEQDIRMWITHGMAPPELRRDPAGHHTSIAPMPGYRDLLTEQDTEDLLAYVLAVSGWRESYTEDEFQGRGLALRLGCFGCHGPSGIGGIPNPGSATGFIPPLGAGDDAELRHWILHGVSPSGDEQQRARGEVRMPAYHDFLSDTELEKLVRYLRSLRTGGSQTDEGNGAAEVIG